MKKITSLFACLFIIGMITLSTPAEASVKDAGIVDAYHEFNVTFSNPLDEGSLDGIVVENTQGEFMPIDVDLSANLKTLTIYPPNEGYVEGENYLLRIPETVKNIYEHALKSAFSISFSIADSESVSVTGIFNSLEDNGTTIVLETSDGHLQKVPFLDDFQSNYYYSVYDQHSNYSQQTFEYLLTVFDRSYIEYVEQNDELHYYLRAGEVTGYFNGFDQVQSNGKLLDEVVISFNEDNEVIDLPMPDDGSYSIVAENNKLQAVTKEQFKQYLMTYDLGVAIKYELENGNIAYTADLAYAEGALTSFIVDDGNANMISGMTILPEQQQEQQELDIPMPNDATYMIEGIGSTPLETSKQQFIQIADTLGKDVYIVYEKQETETVITMKVSEIAGDFKSFITKNGVTSHVVLNFAKGNSSFDLPLAEDADYALAFANSEAQAVSFDSFVALLKAKGAKATISYAVQNEQMTYTAHITSFTGMQNGMQYDDQELVESLSIVANDEYMDIPVNDRTEILVSVAFEDPIKLSRAQLTHIINASFLENELTYTENNGKQTIMIDLFSLGGSFERLVPDTTGTQYYEVTLDGFTDSVRIPLYDNADYMIIDENGNDTTLSFKKFVEHLNTEAKPFHVIYEWFDNEMLYTIYMMQ